MQGRALTVSLVLAGALLPQGGCLVLKADHDELAQEVAKLRREVADQKAQTSTTIEKADTLATELEGKLTEVEDILRRNQADLGLRVENLEVEVQELRGAAENADYMASAAKQELVELRGDVDARVKTLEDKLNEATSIPESKTELFSEAEKLTKGRKYSAARRLWRTYEARYPGDEKMPEVKFNIGLTYFSERDYKSALGEFYRIIQDAPKSEVVPDALYYSGLAFAKLGQCENAIAYFEALRQKKTKAPEQYKQKAGEQIEILKKDSGEICLDKKKDAASRPR